MNNTLNPMVMKAARGLCAHDSQVCGTNAADNWEMYSQNFIDQAQRALADCGALDLLNAAERLGRTKAKDGLCVVLEHRASDLQDAVAKVYAAALEPKP